MGIFCLNNVFKAFNAVIVVTFLLLSSRIIGMIIYKMKYVSLICFCLFGIAAMSQDVNYAGFYSGKFTQGNFEADIQFQIDTTAHQNYTISFNSLKQNAFGIPAGDIRVEHDSLKFALQSDSYRYDFSSYLDENKVLNTTLTVDGHAYDFQLDKQSLNTSTNLISKNIRFRSSELLLYGTIYYPKQPNGKAIYLVTSSGNNDRSASRAEAMLFAKAGFIAFHIDKRGTGISDGNWQLASIPDLCEDDLHALEFLHQSEKIPFAKIGIKGSSQGGTKIPYLLKKRPDLAFGILVSCPASTLLESDLNYWKNRNIEPIGSKSITEATAMQGIVFQYIAGNISEEELQKKIDENKSAPWFSKVWIPAMDEVTIDKKLNYSPMPYFDQNASAMLVLQLSLIHI